MNKLPLLIGLACFVIYRGILFFTENYLLALSIFVLPIAFIIINLLLRKKLRFANWFLSPAHILLEKTEARHSSDISPNLLFDKLLEVIAASEFDLYDSDLSTQRILCGTSPNFWTWGETIYIQIQSNGRENEIIFTAVTNYGTSSWGRNKQHFSSFVSHFEASLII